MLGSHSSEQARLSTFLREWQNTVHACDKNSAFNSPQFFFRCPFYFIFFSPSIFFSFQAIYLICSLARSRFFFFYRLFQILPSNAMATSYYANQYNGPFERPHNQEWELDKAANGPFVRGAWKGVPYDPPTRIKRDCDPFLRNELKV